MLSIAVASALGLVSARYEQQSTVQRYEAVVSELKANYAALENQNKELRQELGLLSMTDADRIYAVKLRTSSKHSWSYRVFLPEGATYFFACQINSLPLDQNPPVVASPPDSSTIATLAMNSMGIGCTSGEFVVTLAIEKIQSQWEYKLNVRKRGDAGDGATGGSRIVESDDQWPTSEGWSSTGGVTIQSSILSEQLPMVLLNHRSMTETMTSSDESSRGVMLWVGLSQ